MSIEKACQSGLIERRFRVVIVTDGVPNCGVDESTLASLPAEWNGLGIETRDGSARFSRCTESHGSDRIRRRLGQVHLFGHSASESADRVESKRPPLLSALVTS
jgi:hypothetical protein